MVRVSAWVKVSRVYSQLGYTAVHCTRLSVLWFLLRILCRVCVYEGDCMIIIRWWIATPNRRRRPLPTVTDRQRRRTGRRLDDGLRSIPRRPKTTATVPPLRRQPTTGAPGAAGDLPPTMTTTTTTTESWTPTSRGRRRRRKTTSSAISVVDDDRRPPTTSCDSAAGRAWVVTRWICSVARPSATFTSCRCAERVSYYSAAADNEVSINARSFFPACNLDISIFDTDAFAKISTSVCKLLVCLRIEHFRWIVL